MGIGPTEQPLEGMLTRAASGDARAWRALVDSYSPRVFALVLKQCRDRELAEELTQAAFVKMVQNIGRYQEQGRFEAWLFRIAMNLLRDEMRRRKRQAGPIPTTAASRDGGRNGDVWRNLADHADTQPDPLERLTRAEQIEQLQAAIAQLSEPEQVILQLRHTAGLSFAQIAETLDQPLGTVLARGHRTLAKLRTMMNGRAPVQRRANESMP